MKKFYTVLVVLVLASGVSYIILRSDPRENKTDNQITTQNYKDSTYIIEGQSITLAGGVSEIVTAPDSASKTVTRYFGNEVKHDFNNDGYEDVAFLLTQETGGSGVYYYVVAALNTPDGYKGSHAFFLGDRISPQTTEIDEGETTNGTFRKDVLVVNYVERKPDEPYTAQPSMGKSVWLKLDLDTMQFGEVAQNFEGESR